MKEAIKSNTSPMQRFNPLFIAIFLVLYSFPFGNGFFAFAKINLPFSLDLIFYFVIPIFIGLYLYRYKQETFTEIRYEGKYDNHWSTIIWAIVFGILSVRLFNFLQHDLYRPSLALLRNLNLANPSIILQGVAPTFATENSSKYWHLTKALYGAITAGVVEELLYKSVLIRISKKEFGITRFTLLSSILFCAVHFEQGLISSLLILFIWGIPTAIYYYKERKLLPLIVMHITADFIFFF